MCIFLLFLIFYTSKTSTNYDLFYFLKKIFFSKRAMNKSDLDLTYITSRLIGKLKKEELANLTGHSIFISDLISLKSDVMSN
jgi:hypothetical protein